MEGIARLPLRRTVRGGLEDCFINGRTRPPGASVFQRLLQTTAPDTTPAKHKLRTGPCRARALYKGPGS